MMSKKRKVLIAEDSGLTQKVTLYMLEKQGYEVVGQSMNGEDAVRDYEALKPDIVLMDLAMPKKDGISAIKDILVIDPNARIIAVSALYNPEMKENAMKAGAKDYIIKPFEILELLNAIEQCLNENI